MKILTKELFSKLIKEAIGDDFNAPDTNDSFENDTPTLSVEDMLHTLPDQLKINLQKLDIDTETKIINAIKLAVQKGKGVYDYNLYGTNPSIFNTYTDILAVLYNNISGKEKENIRTAMFEIFSPYPKDYTSTGTGEARLSTFGNKLLNMLGNYADSGENATGGAAHSILMRQNNVAENLIEAIYSSIDVALSKSEVGTKQSFQSFLSNIIRNKVIDLWRKQNVYQQDGEKHVRQFSSLDKNIDDSDPDSGTAGDYLSSDSLGHAESSYARLTQRIYPVFINFLTKPLENKPVMKIIFNAFVNDGGDGGYSISSKDIAEKIKLETGKEIAEKDINVYKSRLVDGITTVLKSGMMDKHIRQTTGDRVDFAGLVKNKFPLEACRYEFFAQNIAKHLNEMKKVRDGLVILKEASIKLKKIDQLCLSFESTIPLLKEGNETQAPELYGYLKGFIDECLKIVNALQVEFGNVHRIVAEIKSDYPELSEQLSLQIEPLVNNFFAIPEKLKNVVRTFKKVNTGGIQKPYDDKPFGI